jgi:hypothetical protein
MQRYSPFRSALSAAAAELSSPAARRFYVNRAQQDLQTALVLIVQLGCFAFAFGQSCRQWMDEMEQSAQVQPVAPGAIVRAESAAVALLAPTASVRVVAIASVTPAALPSFQHFALLSPTPKAKRNRAKSSTHSTEAPVGKRGGRKPKALVTA